MGDPTTWFAVIIAAALCPLTLQSPPMRKRIRVPDHILELLQ